MRKNKDMFPIINKKETAKRLKYLMMWNHVKPADVQEYLGLTCVQTVYRWLEGINIPSVDNLYALSQLFNIKDECNIRDRRGCISDYCLHVGMDSNHFRKC